MNLWVDVLLNGNSNHLQDETQGLAPFLDFV